MQGQRATGRRPGAWLAVITLAFPGSRGPILLIVPFQRRVLFQLERFLFYQKDHI